MEETNFARVHLLIRVMPHTLHTRVEVVLVKNFLHQPLVGSRPFSILLFSLLGAFGPPLSISFVDVDVDVDVDVNEVEVEFLETTNSPK